MIASSDTLIVGSRTPRARAVNPEAALAAVAAPAAGAEAALDPDPELVPVPCSETRLSAPEQPVSESAAPEEPPASVWLPASLAVVPAASAPAEASC